MTHAPRFLLRVPVCAFCAAICILVACDLFSPDDENQAPVITIKGANPDTLGIYHTYIDSGASATDAEDGDLTDSIEVTSTIDTAQTGSYTIVYEVTDNDGNTATATRTIVVVDNTVEVSTSSCPAVYDCTSVTYTIPGRMTIPAGCDVTFGAYTRVEILGDLEVNGSLTIEEGAHILLDDDVNITVNQGLLTAEGHDTARIMFSNYSAGTYWGEGEDNSYNYSRYGLLFNDGANVTSSLAYCVFDSATTGVRVEKDGISISNCTFSHCAYAGVFFDACGPKDSTAFMHNAFVENGKNASFFPMHIDATYLGRLSGTATFTANAVDAIAVEGGDVTEYGSWKKCAVPYVFNGNVTIHNTSGVEVTVHPGAAFEFKEDVSLTVQSATFIAEGTAAETISFSSYEYGKYWGEGDDGSYWYSRYGLHFTDNANPNSSLAHCVFDSATVGLRVEKDGIAINNCTFTNCAYAGMYFDDCGPRDSTAFMNNAFSTNGKTVSFFPMYIQATYLSRLSGTATFTGNAVDAVAVTHGDDVSESGSWKKQDVPYVFTDAATIDNSNGVTITVHPGSRFQFQDDTYLKVEHGTLIAEGTASDSIWFTTYENGVYWGDGDADSYDHSRYGINITDNANANCAMSYCVVDSATTGINSDECPVSISHCTITNCLVYGIYSYGAGNTNIDYATISFSGNGTAPYFHEN